VSEAIPPPGRPLTPAQTRLVQLLAQITVEEFLATPDTPPEEGRHLGGTSMNMPFGRYRGLPLRDLPDPYLSRLRSLDDLREPLLSAVDDELDRRGGAQRTRAPYDATLAQEIVAAGYRSLAKLHHPDGGGDLQMMKKLNATAEWLRDRVGVIT
jgi:putative quorum-sensing-regulated virulence factor